MASMRASATVAIFLVGAAGAILLSMWMVLVALTEDANFVLAALLALEFAVLVLFVGKAIETATLLIDVRHIECFELQLFPHVIRRVSISWCDVTSVEDEGYVLRINTESAKLRLNLGLFWDMDSALAFVRQHLPAGVPWIDAGLRKT